MFGLGAVGGDAALPGFARGGRTDSAGIAASHGRLLIGHRDRAGSLFGGGGLLAFRDRDGEEGQSLDEAADIVLHRRDHPAWHEPAGPRRDGPDQTYQGDAEALRRGKGWGFVHVLFLQ